MKVCVYGLAKNQEHLCTAWIESVKHADEIIVGDLGSTDSTKEILQSYGVKVYDINIAFRYDVARNTLLSLIPKNIDFAISCDLNQLMSSNWKSILNDELLPGTDRVSCLHITTDNKYHDVNIIHSVPGYIWENAVFAELKNKHSEQVVSIDRIIISDVSEFIECNTEQLLDVALSETPSNDLLQWKYAMILLKKLQLEKSYDIVKDFASNSEFKRVVNLFKTIALDSKSEFYRAEAMIKLSQMLPTETHSWLTTATAEASWYWKPYHELAKYFYKKNDWYFYLAASMKSLGLFNSEDATIRGYIHDNICVAAWNCNLKELSLTHAKLAAELVPNDQRLQQNLTTIKKILNVEEK